MRVEKKLDKTLFEKVEKGEKNFDVRLADLECRKGDTIVLKEWDSDESEYTGRTIEKEVSFVLNTKDIPNLDDKEVASYGYQVLALK